MGRRFKTCKEHQAIKEMRNLAKGASAGMFANKRLETGFKRWRNRRSAFLRGAVKQNGACKSSELKQ